MSALRAERAGRRRRAVDPVRAARDARGARLRGGRGRRRRRPRSRRSRRASTRSRSSTSACRGRSGLELLDRVQSLGIDTAVVIITAQNSFENAVEAMKRGALDYLVKPFGMDEVKALATKALRTRALEREVKELRREVGRRTVPGERLVGEVDRDARGVQDDRPRRAARRARARDRRERHRQGARGARDPRREPARRQAVRRGQLRRDPAELLESELFGHERGAFTGAVAARAGRFRGGRRHALPRRDRRHVERLQAKLLRVLQERQVTPVGSSATHRSTCGSSRRPTATSTQRCASGSVPRGPALPAARGADAPAAAARAARGRARARRALLAALCAELAGAPRSLTDAALELLRRHSWPGNVRELENAVKRALVLGSSALLVPEDFAFVARGRDAAQRGDARRPRAPRGGGRARRRGRA